jgi:endonuclease/exonuclease/phosphatase (EEP) superfamily protein YafD
LRDILCKAAVFLSGGYLLLLLTWLTVYTLSGDSHGYIAALNWLAHYLFLPLPLALLAAFFCRSRGLAAGALVGALTFLLLYGELFVPQRAAPTDQPTLSVMTYNVLAYHTFTEPILDTILHEDADIVMIQELNFMLAHQVGERLGDVYPYQFLEPTANAFGIGTISKHPLTPRPERLPHPAWLGGPQIFEMDWQGETIRLVNFHFRPTSRLAAPDAIAQTFRQREEQARLIASLAQQPGPVIAAGDANSGHLSTARRIFLQEFDDAWARAGFGLGNTFPGSDIPGSDRPRIAGVLVPPWLVRIDYVFATRHWDITEARLARFDQVSDHRGVIAVLRLKKSR